LREIERVADGIGDILNVPRRVVVRQDVGVTFLLEPGDFRLEPTVLVLRYIFGIGIGGDRRDIDRRS
jgi:hypothetical protein